MKHKPQKRKSSVGKWPRNTLVPPGQQCKKGLNFHQGRKRVSRGNSSN